MDDQLRELERAAQSGDQEAVERYLVARLRVAPDLSTKLIKRLIRLERVVTSARMNEADYFADVTPAECLAFLDREAPERPRHAGQLTVEGEESRDGGPGRGGNVVLSGGRSGTSPLSITTPSNMELHHMILALTLRIDLLERGAV